MTNPRLMRLFLLALLITGGALLYLEAPPPAATQVRVGAPGDAAGGGLQDYDAPSKSPGDDISLEQRSKVERKIKDYEARYGTQGPKRVDGAAASAALTSLQPYPFHPQAGSLWQDLFITNFADLDSSGGMLDWDCSNYTYDGHQGHDSAISSFKRQAIGVPVFAALDGVVVDAHDGEPDMNTTWANQPANYVVLDHGNSHYTWYFHLKKGSVAVALNQLVKAGTQLGLTGSSGISTGPHLHFESRYQGTWYEPSAGPCRPGASNWVSQTPIRRGLYARDFVISPSGFTGTAGLPFDEAVRTGTFLAGQRTVYFRVHMGDMPAASTYRIRFVRPDGATSLDYPGAFNNSSPAHGWYYWFSFNWNLNPAGGWRLLLDINGVTIVDAPFRVVATEAEITNRPPNPVTGVAFDPATPTPDDAIFCRVQTSLVTEDPDYDLVRYRYQWSRNGVVIRDRVSAALSDAIPKGTYQAGDTLTCKVTPSDGTASGPAAAVTFPNCNGTLTPAGKSFTYTGGAGSVSLTTGSSCAWTAKSNVSWVTLAAGSASGTGSKTIGYTVAANTGAASRTGTLTVAGKTFTVTQSAQTYAISGAVKVGTAPLAGVTVKVTSPTPLGFTPRTATTNTLGTYSFANLPAGRTYYVTAVKTNYTFTPASRTYTALSANQAAANFAATLKTYNVSGRVTRTGTTTGISGVTVTVSSPTPAGFTPRVVTTNSYGTYAVTALPAGRTYVIKPAKAGFTFSPLTKSLTNLSGNVGAGTLTNFTGVGP